MGKCSNVGTFRAILAECNLTQRLFDLLDGIKILPKMRGRVAHFCHEDKKKKGATVIIIKYIKYIVHQIK